MIATESRMTVTLQNPVWPLQYRGGPLQNPEWSLQNLERSLHHSSRTQWQFQNQKWPECPLPWTQNDCYRTKNGRYRTQKDHNIPVTEPRMTGSYKTRTQIDRYRTQWTLHPCYVVWSQSVNTSWTGGLFGAKKILMYFNVQKRF